MIFRKAYRALRSEIANLRKLKKAPGIKSKVQALFYLTVHRESFLRKIISPVHAAIVVPDSQGLISITLTINRATRYIYLRHGNHGDYRVIGELIDEICRAPDFQPESIYDGGANIGVFSIFAASQFPSTPIICFEPDATNTTLLRKNLEVNQINAEIREAGLWDRECTLYYHPGRSSIEGITNEEPSDFPVKVECLEPSNPNVWIKLDIEGAEYQVLPALLNSAKRPRYLSLELHFFNTKGSQLMELLRKNGYEIMGYFDTSSICAVFDAELAQFREELNGENCITSQ